MRRKDQAERRRPLEVAARQVLLERGAVGVRVKDVADRAGLAPSSVLYYYPSLDELLIEVSRGAIERFAERRAAAVRRVAKNTKQPRRAGTARGASGPAGGGAGGRVGPPAPRGPRPPPDDTESRLLYELDAFTGSSPAFGI